MANRSSKTHALQALLQDVLRSFFPLPEIRVCWIAHYSAANRRDQWGQTWWTRDGRFIGISDRLQRAPRYVVRYVLFHEVLHIALLPRATKTAECAPGRAASCPGGYRVIWHHRAFRVAERIWPDYERACDWLDAHC